MKPAKAKPIRLGGRPKPQTPNPFTPGSDTHYAWARGYGDALRDAAGIDPQRLRYMIDRRTSRERRPPIRMSDDIIRCIA